MTPSRRGLFGLGAGAAAAVAMRGFKLPSAALSSTEAVITGEIVSSGTITATQIWAGTTMGPAVFERDALDATLAKMWASYEVKPTTIRIGPRDLAIMTTPRPRFDLFGVRFRRAVERTLAELQSD